MISEKTRLVGARIKFIRMGKHLPQREVAEKIGVSQAHMSNIECGRSHVTLENLIKLSEVLEVKVRDFFVDLDGAEDPVKAENGMFTLVDLANALLQLKK